MLNSLMLKLAMKLRDKGIMLISKVINESKGKDFDETIFVYNGSTNYLVKHVLRNVFNKKSYN